MSRLHALARAATTFSNRSARGRPRAARASAGLRGRRRARVRTGSALRAQASQARAARPHRGRPARVRQASAGRAPARTGRPARAARIAGLGRRAARVRTGRLARAGIGLGRGRAPVRTGSAARARASARPRQGARPRPHGSAFARAGIGRPRQPARHGSAAAPRAIPALGRGFKARDRTHCSPAMESFLSPRVPRRSVPRPPSSCRLEPGVSLGTSDSGGSFGKYFGDPKGAQHDLYLGLPSIVGKSQKAVFSSLRDKVWNRISGRNEKMLSHAGKGMLIKAVLQSIPTYAMGVFRLPEGVLRDIQSLVC
ncbi:UNVERIFIED_CONTAM: hypothetical protein Scaly_1969900 [Sesamum calycinum]|uniref:Uncharacterized protein n=1 Tax=Sesamum calycinum TaxID=2727403 RepID=A0AAW2N188_9LAMI